MKSHVNLSILLSACLLIGAAHSWSFTATSVGSSSQEQGSSSHEGLRAQNAKCASSEAGDMGSCRGIEGCTWCVLTQKEVDPKESGVCLSGTIASLLSKEDATCDGQSSDARFSVEDNKKGTCGDFKEEDKCISPDCVWCTSAAVGGGCYTPDQAKLLPSAIFHCKTAPE